MGILLTILSFVTREGSGRHYPNALLCTTILDPYVIGNARIEIHIFLFDQADNRALTDLHVRDRPAVVVSGLRNAKTGRFKGLSTIVGLYTFERDFGLQRIRAIDLVPEQDQELGAPLKDTQG